MYELYVSNKQKKLVFLFFSYIYMISKICTLYRNKEHFEYALLNRLDLLELDLKGSSQYLFIIIFLVYKIQKLQMELLETNPNVKIHIDSGPFL